MTTAELQRCAGCSHPLAEHYADGCGWCICKVAGTATEDVDQATTTTAAPREVDPILDTFEIAGRGTAYVTIEPDPLYEVNEEVVMAGKHYRIVGIERFAIEPKPGRNISLLLREVVPNGE